MELLGEQVVEKWYRLTIDRERIEPVYIDCMGRPDCEYIRYRQEEAVGCKLQIISLSGED